MTTILSKTSKYTHLVSHPPVKAPAFLLSGFWGQVTDLYD